MSYPFAQMPTVAEFIETMTGEPGVTLRTTDSTVVGPKGPVTFRYLERTGSEAKRSQPLPDDDTKRLTPEVIRAVCRQLDVPVEHFEGFELG